MKRNWQIMCLAFAPLSLATLILSFEYPYMDKLGPGPGFFPTWMAIITGGLSILLFCQITFTKSAPYGKNTLLPNREGGKRIFAILIALAVCLALLDFLGFRISLLLFLLFLPPALGVRNWWATAVFAVAGSFGIFHAFYYWLKVPLPIGIIGI
jgi:putative tricarboxylic transport membrane protein